VYTLNVELMSELSQQEYEAVNTYALKRRRERGDVYGWAPLGNDSAPQALLLVSKEAPLDSFPERISGIKLILRAIEAPERHNDSNESRS